MALPRSRIGLGRIDAAVDRMADVLRRPALDGLFFRVSSSADHSLLWVVVLGVRGTVDPHLARPCLRLCLALPVESFVTNVVVKSLFRRLRPPPPSLVGRLPFGMRRPITSAFPSGHASSAFMVATVLGPLDRYGPLYYAAATVVSVSRIYVRMHHASDVVGGIVLGMLLGRLARPLVGGGTGPRNPAGPAVVASAEPRDPEASP